jgi:hypothetical protein
MKRRRFALGAAAAFAAFLWLTCLTASCTRKTPPTAKTPKAAHSASLPSAAVSARRILRRQEEGPLHFIVVGGGATPESTEVSLEQDVDLVRRTLPGPGAVLFAGGSDSRSVREIDPAPHGDALLVSLGELFHPRTGRHSRYRAPHLDAERATVENVEARIKTALSEGDGPLLIYVAAHGDQGKTPRDNSIALWGGRPLTVSRFAELTALSSRPVRLVATSCFSGGFAELAFSRADERGGPNAHVRCGLFAGTWDRQTSGCDANPDRRAQESYGLHFIHALSRTDRTGKTLPPDAIDFDHDGRVGLLDAHTRARIAAASLDVPTTTSERFLRSVEKASGPIDRALLPEDAAVVAELGAALGVHDEAAAEWRWTSLEERLDALNDDLDDANKDVADAEGELGARLLERWPVLDDPFHPDFASMFGENRAAIAAILEHSREAKTREDAAHISDTADAEMAQMEVEEARLLRLRRAYETLHLAAALVHRGGAGARYYRALLECERGAP